MQDRELAEELVLITIDSGDAEAVAPKSCEWLIEHGRALYCGAASQKNETASVDIDGRLSAPTALESAGRVACHA